MEITKFNKLRLAIAALGAEPAIAELEKKLKSSGVDIEKGSTVATGNGIYYIDKRGLLTKVVIHIVDKTVDGRYSKNLPELVSHHQFESEELINEINKFHILKCTTIEGAERNGWADRYKGSKRTDGRFFYRFLKDNQVLSEQNNQKLNVCKNCLKLVAKQTGKNLTVDNFDLNSFFEVHEELNNLNQNVQSEMACAPNVYQADWSDISIRYKNINKYQCQGINCTNPDLSDPALRKYLHTHHKSFDKTNNQISNLEALCVKCHAEQPHHSHLKTSPDYKAYLKLREIKIGGPKPRKIAEATAERVNVF
jgi:hypothetical protein